jgi:uncharacterized protein (DUF488 family)
MADFDLFSIGHSNISADRFIALVRGAGADTVADVRSTPNSRFFPWFSHKNLATRLAQESMSYLAYGDGLGGRPRGATLYRDGIADYEAMARQVEFRAGLDRLLSEPRRICLMCAEREPLDCHRCLLVARSLAERGVTVGHILHDGSIEPHAATERRLLAWAAVATEGDLFRTGDPLATRLGERLAAAYWRRARSVAYRGNAKAKAGRDS